MKLLKTPALLLIFILVLFTNKTNAQDNKSSKYYFAWAYNYEANSMLISDIKSTDCLTYGIEYTELMLQWRPFLKAEHKNSFNFTLETSYHKNEKEAVEYKRKIMERWEHSILKIHDFKYYCDED